MSCALTTKSLNAGNDCGCSDDGFPGMPGLPFNININNNANPFIGRFSPNMQPVVNTPPVVITPQQAVVGGQYPGYAPENTIIDTPIERRSRTRVIRREPIVLEEPEEQIIEEAEVGVVASTKPLKRKPFFKKHFVPTFY